MRPSCNSENRASVFRQYKTTISRRRHVSADQITTQDTILKLKYFLHLNGFQDQETLTQTLFWKPYCIFATVMFLAITTFTTIYSNSTEISFVTKNWSIYTLNLHAIRSQQDTGLGWLQALTSTLKPKAIKLNALLTFCAREDGTSRKTRSPKPDHQNQITKPDDQNSNYSIRYWF